jgi:hypothetical protein
MQLPPNPVELVWEELPATLSAATLVTPQASSAPNSFALVPSMLDASEAKSDCQPARKLGCPFL